MDPRTTRKALAALGAAFALLLLAGPASARPDVVQPQPATEESDAFARFLANHQAHDERIDAATWGDQSDAFQRYLANLRADKQAYHATRTGIPDSVAAALERNAVADKQVYHATRTGIPDSVATALERNAVAEPTVIPYLSHGLGVDSTATLTLRQQPDGFQPQLRGLDSAPVADDGFNWETTGYVAGAILAAMLLALMSTIALRDRRGLKSA